MQSQSDTPRHANRLALESSPYLLQHQHNPVDWYAWGPEAFEAARSQNKPIFLSVGYSTCYWCHVMERESFENESVAAEMNSRFINIKVDREERPDVDSLYMTAVQVITRQGGWPMSVFLTPELRPFYGGTYFPPTDAHGRPGFVTLLTGIDDAWRNRRTEVEKSADQLSAILTRLALPPGPEQAITINEQFIDGILRRSISDYEPRFGGFGHAPKFPRETLLELLLTSLTATSGSTLAPSTVGLSRNEIEKPLRHTLDAMAYGGIRDQLGGGFHRYSTDSRWLVPHFEIMLYDNAMLGLIYSEASRQFAEPRHAQIAREIFDFILREMTSPEGAFYTAFDAEVDAREGLSYLWTKEQIESVLGASDAAHFNRLYGVDRGPNFADPHHGTGTPDTSILFIPDPGDGSILFDAKVRAMRQKLYDARRLRKQPLLDTKILTSWNALMIRALARGGNVLGEQRYIEAATRAAEFLLSRHRTPAGGIHRTSRDGAAKYNAFLDDYAFLAQALLELGRATGATRWRDEASAIVTAMIAGFRDRVNEAFYFTDAQAGDLIARQMTAADSPLPSGNGVAALVFLELGRVDEARRVLSAFAAQLDDHAEGMSAMVQAALLCIKQYGPFTITDVPDDAQGERPLPPARIAEGIVQIKPHWVSPTELHVRLEILDGFHINANDPQGNDVPLIPTTLTITDGFGAAADIERVDYPLGEEQAFAFAEKPIRVYSGAVVAAVRFRAVTVGSGDLQLHLGYQACNDNACLPAVRKTVSLKPK